MKKILTLTTLFLLITTAHSQPQELEDISLEMLRATSSENDPSADAEVLYEKGQISFKMTESWEYVHEVIRRIKIYTKDGYDQANVQIPYYMGDSSSDKESVSKIKGYVYYEDGGKVKREKLKRKDVFSIDVNDLWKAKKFTLPKVQDGVILEYSYQISSPHVSNLPVWVFQNEIPTRYSEYETKIPIEYLAYNVKSKGYEPFQTLTDETTSPIYVRPAKSQVRLTLKESRHFINNLPKIEEESYVNNVSNYLPSVGYELSSYKTGEYRATKSVSRTWDDVVQTLSETDTHNKELTRVKYFKKDLGKILKDLDAPKDKMTAVFDVVKHKMTWNGDERRYTSDKLNKIYDKKVGNSADINIMLTAMLREAGLEANPVLSSTISNGVPLFPTVSGFNYIFTHVEIDGETFLLDATDEFSTPNILPKRLLNWSGTVIKPNAFETLDLVPKSNSVKRYQVQANLAKDGKIEGVCRIASMDYFGLESRSLLNKKSNDDKKLRYEKNFNISEISNISTSNMEDLDKPLLEGFSFEGKGEYAEKIGDKIYLSPMLFLNSKENPFKDEKRKYPVDFTYPRLVDYFITIALPEGYSVDYVPEKTILKVGENAFSLTYLIEAKENMVSVIVKQETNTVLLLPNDYDFLKDYYTNLINKENEKIVLVKS